MVWQYNMQRSSIIFLLRKFFSIFGLHDGQNHIHSGLATASYSEGLYFMHLMQKVLGTIFALQ